MHPANLEYLGATGDARGFINSTKAMGIIMNDDRKVQLPLSDLRTCSRCGRRGERFPVCSQCGEKAYCGEPCQSADWETHKKQCGKDRTDRIELLAFIPMIAALMEWYRRDDIGSMYDLPAHPALSHRITNSPNPDAPLDQLFDGSSTRVVKFGAPMSPEEVLESPEKWWPTASNDQVRNKLMRRIECERFLVPSIVSALVALLAEMYTTKYLPAKDTFLNKMKRRIRLKYRDSPIADFGIAKGSVDVKPEDTLAYEGTGMFMRGLDPANHYWIYFTTASGEELILDCGLYALNYCQVVNTERYGLDLDPPIRDAPFYFQNRSERNPPIAHHEKERFSVLRDFDLQEDIEWTQTATNDQERQRNMDALTKSLGEFVERVQGNRIMKEVKQLTAARCLASVNALAIRFAQRQYLGYTMVSESDIETK
ncbi:hypothetical protein DFP72DRAFT_918295 [Ephemerocybe angulata]|uniref:MYND-type domain-containing protein n=1 Tax=Ephemerocybe angulata TaxID=980116 RepID=A0A8H6LYQ0_9AGAR|nr:hypothetical protein DFP72DRAFT_918295 [Tulosesus angulatus]